MNICKPYKDKMVSVSSFLLPIYLRCYFLLKHYYCSDSSSLSLLITNIRSQLSFVPMWTVRLKFLPQIRGLHFFFFFREVWGGT